MISSFDKRFRLGLNQTLSGLNSTTRNLLKHHLTPSKSHRIGPAQFRPNEEYKNLADRNRVTFELNCAQFLLHFKSLSRRQNQDWKASAGRVYRTLRDTAHMAAILSFERAVRALLLEARLFPRPIEVSPQAVDVIAVSCSVCHSWGRASLAGCKAPETARRTFFFSFFVPKCLSLPQVAVPLCSALLHLCRCVFLFRAPHIAKPQDNRFPEPFFLQPLAHTRPRLLCWLYTNVKTFRRRYRAHQTYPLAQTVNFRSKSGRNQVRIGSESGLGELRCSDGVRPRGVVPTGMAL